MMLLICVIGTISMSMPYAANANEQVKVYVHGNQIRFTQPPYTEKGNTLVQMRPIYEAIGMEVIWDAKARTITSSVDRQTIVMKVDSTEASINGKLTTLPVAPRIIHGSVFVPLRFIVESVDGDIRFNKKDNRIDMVTDQGYYTYQAAMINDLQKVKHWAERAGTNYVNRQDGRDALSYGIRHKNEEMVELLLLNGADPNHHSISYGDSVKPLVYAVLAKDPEIVELLLEYGADANHREPEGSALDMARDMLLNETNETDRQQLQQIVKMLEQAIAQDAAALSDQRMLIPFNNGEVSIIKGKTGRWGYIDKTGKTAIKPRFAFAMPFSEDLAFVSSQDRRLSGYIDRSGKFAFTFDFVPELLPGEFIEGLAPVGTNGKWGFIDKSGAFAIEPKFDYAESFSEGFASVQKDGKWGVINRAGEWVAEPDYESIFPFLNNLALVRGEQNGFINTNGEVVIDFDKLGISEYGIFTGEYAPVSKDGKIGYINTSGQFVIPPRFVWASNFYEGLAAVNVDGKYGYIDMSGQFVIPTQYELAYRFRNGQALVRQDGKYGFINREGEMVVPPEFDRVENIFGDFPLQHLPFSDKSGGMAILYKRDQIYYVLPNGEIIRLQKQ
ncbi:WG repeat-containing protein [Paenibacillus tarimensis]